MYAAPGYEVRFDAIEWSRCGELVLYNTDWTSEWYMDIMPFSLAAQGGRSGVRVQPIRHRPGGGVAPAEETAVFGG
jgi:hypothetical protein